MATPQDEYNQKAAAYLGGNFRNALRSVGVDSTPREQVLPWFGQGGALQSIGTAPTTAPAAQPVASWPRGQAVTPAVNTSAAPKVVPGNLDPTKPMSYVKNADGSVSTVRTISIGTDKGETLIPTVTSEGKVVSNEQAIDLFRKSGDNFGSYPTRADADNAAAALHSSQAGLINTPQVRRLIPGMSLSADRTTYTMGTPGQDGYGRMTVAPGSAPTGSLRPSSPYSVVGDKQAQDVFNAPSGPAPAPAPMDALNGGSRMAMLEQQQMRQTAPATSTPIDFANMTRDERRFALRNAQLDQAQQQISNSLDTATTQAANSYDLGLRQVAASREPRPLPEVSPSEVGLRAAQATEAQARAKLADTQATAAATQGKWISTFEEVPTLDPATGMTVMQKQGVLFNTATKETVRPGATQAPAADDPLRAKFVAEATANPQVAKKFNALSKPEQDALFLKYRDSQTAK